MPSITAQQIEAVKAEFKEFDKNNDGKLSRKEYYVMLRTDGKDLNHNHIKVFFYALEPKANGSVDFNDLVKLMNDVSNGNVELLKTELAKNLFKHYDRNHDGTINFKEFKKIANDFELNDDHKTKEMFDKIDTSDDHKVNSDELIKSLGQLFGF